MNMGRRKRTSVIPDRWTNYSKIGKVIAGTNLFAFKTPLSMNICEKMPEPARHTTNDVIEALPNIGLIINLTNTQTATKYYQPDDWISKGIDYRWIKVEGHITPAKELLVKFCRIVRKFMHQNPTKLIGIHCTHGLNRTGYFVCSYMVLVMSIPPSEALQRFAFARGYDIERENYICSIFSHRSNTRLKEICNASLTDLEEENQIVITAEKDRVDEVIAPIVAARRIRKRHTTNDEHVENKRWRNAEPSRDYHNQRTSNYSRPYDNRYNYNKYTYRRDQNVSHGHQSSSNPSSFSNATSWRSNQPSFSNATSWRSNSLNQTSDI